jgi:neopullulanase
MNRFRALALILLSVASGLAPASRAAPGIERIEPPNWWIGMRWHTVTLMVHGEGISAFTPSVSHPGVRIESVTTTDNSNYLFIDLKIDEQAVAGSIDLVFHRGSQQLHYSYPLLRREPNSALRASFTSADVIIDVMPDRFSNGNVTNDNVPGYADRVDRHDPNGRHGGDIQGVMNHLDYLADMGFSMLWLTPLTENNQPEYSYHGYAATDTYRIDPRYGTNTDYKRLVQTARQRGIGVIHDIVLNHIGSNHWWMKDMPAKDWISNEGHFIPTLHARTTANDPYASEADRDNFVTGWFSASMPDVNQRNRLVANYQIQNTLWWIEYAGLAGLRVDTYGYSDHAFLTEWSRSVTDEYPRMNIVGEEWSTNPVTVAYWQRGKVNPNGYVSYLPSVMDFPLLDVLRKALVAPDNLHSGLTDLYEALTNDTLYADPHNLVLVEGNHDIPRTFSMLDEDLSLFKMALAYVLTIRGIPQLYYGTEILMTSPKVRDDGRTREDFPGGWVSDKVNAFTGDGLSVQQKEAQAYVKKLIHWRRAHRVVADGKLVHFFPDHGTYVYFRYNDASKVMVVFNKNAAEQALAMPRFREILPANASGTDAITGQQFDLSRTLVVPPRSVLVLEIH